MEEKLRKFESAASRFEKEPGDPDFLDDEDEDLDGDEDLPEDEDLDEEDRLAAAQQVEPTKQVVDPGERKYHWGTGRRKTSVARVRLRPGTGEFLVNGRALKEFFPRLQEQRAAHGPLETLKVSDKVDVFAKVHGGGNAGQAGAVRLGIGRALIFLYPDARDALRDAGHLTRDPRMVERKKYGLRGARRAFQWVKR